MFVYVLLLGANLALLFLCGQVHIKSALCAAHAQLSANRRIGMLVAVEYRVCSRAINFCIECCILECRYRL